MIEEGLLFSLVLSCSLLFYLVLSCSDIARYYYRCLVFSSCQDTLMVNSCGNVANLINCPCLVLQAASIVFKSKSLFGLLFWATVASQFIIRCESWNISQFRNGKRFCNHFIGIEYKLYYLRKLFGTLLCCQIEYQNCGCESEALVHVPRSHFVL